MYRCDVNMPEFFPFFERLQTFILWSIDTASSASTQPSNTSCAYTPVYNSPTYITVRNPSSNVGVRNPSPNVVVRDTNQNVIVRNTNQNAVAREVPPNATIRKFAPRKIVATGTASIPTHSNNQQVTSQATTPLSNMPSQPLENPSPHQDHAYAYQRQIKNPSPQNSPSALVDAEEFIQK